MGVLSLEDERAFEALKATARDCLCIDASQRKMAWEVQAHLFEVMGDNHWSNDLRER